MKNTKTLLFVFCALVAGAMVSCTKESPSSVNPSTIVSQANDLLASAGQNICDATLKVGYYEVSSPLERAQLRRLAAVGLITYDEERFVWWEKRIVSYSYTSYESYYDWYWGWQSYPVTETRTAPKYTYEDHLLVKVALTEAGQKLIAPAREPVEMKNEDELVQPMIDFNKFPESTVTCEWNKAEVKNPFITPEEPKEPKTTPAPRHTTTYTPSAPRTTTKPAGPKVERILESQYLAYTRVENQLHEETVTLSGYKIKAKKGRYIQVMEKEGKPVANIEVVFKVYDVTEAGRILLDMREGDYVMKDFRLMYYYDRGWKIIK